MRSLEPSILERGGFHLVASLFAPEEAYDTLYLSNYATLRIKDELARINGVGAVRISPQTAEVSLQSCAAALEVFLAK